MGRPLGKNFFGNMSGDIRLYANFNGSVGTSVAAYIIKQTGTGKYLATDGTHTMIVSLIADPTKVVPGQATLAVTPFTGGTQYARVLNRHVVKTFSDKVYDWSLTTASNTEQAVIDHF